MANSKNDKSISFNRKMISPKTLKGKLPISEDVANTISNGRATLKRILTGEDSRLFIVVGPCSIHDIHSAYEYAQRLKLLAEEVSDTLYLVMRTYFEKPRTTLGWKGLINDPYLDKTFKVQDGLHMARNILLDIAKLGLPTATEFVDLISWQYLEDLITWSGVGARTTESQSHREIASGLSSVVGFKNNIEGNLSAAINSLKSVADPHSFLGVNCQGSISIIKTTGNHDTHIVLRGGRNKPNYGKDDINLCEKMLTEANLPLSIMVDCSHANANRNAILQVKIIENITQQILSGNSSIKALMIESSLNEGNQSIPDNLNLLKYGVSITDPCINWINTEEALREMHYRLKNFY